MNYSAAIQDIRLKYLIKISLSVSILDIILLVDFSDYCRCTTHKHNWSCFSDSRGSEERVWVGRVPTLWDITTSQVC